MIIAGSGIPRFFDKEQKLLGLEIGCDIGGTSDFLLTQLPNLTLHAVDPYTDYIDWNGHYLNQREELFRYVLKRFEPFGERFVLYRTTSDVLFENIEDNLYDFIFIDGLHTYDQVLADCKNYYSKLKEGGLFCGHDYNAIKVVRQAVDEFASTVGKEILQTDTDVWYWKK